MPKTEYQRLTRARSRGGFSVAVVSRTTLWLGTDHLLFVDSNGYTETYKRFYFRDIQAFIVQKTPAFTIVNKTIPVPFIFFLAAATIAQSTGLRIFLGCLAGLFALIVLINLWRGQTCRSFLRTAVQIEQLPPLCRIRRAQKVFARVRPLIAAAQGGELSPETISTLLKQHVQPSATISPGAAQNPVTPPRLDF